MKSNFKLKIRGPVFSPVRGTRKTLARGCRFCGKKKNEKHLLKKLKQIKTTVLNVPLKTCQERFYF